MKVSEQSQTPQPPEFVRTTPRTINTELIEHRIDELQKSVEENRKDISEIKTSVVKIEAKSEKVATDTDIERLKVWILSGVLGGMVAAAGITVGVIKLFG